MNVCWLEIRGKIDIRMLSPMTLYAAYLVFKLTTGAYGFQRQPMKTTVGLVGGESLKRTVYLDARTPVPEENDNVPYPQVRGDGWLEIELGDFFYGGDGQDGELEMTLFELGGWKRGLIVQGIEIRPKVLN